MYDKKLLLMKFNKIIIFLVLFCNTWFCIQWVLHYRWTGHDAIYSRNMCYQEETPNTIDVLYFGTSEVYASVFPTVMYESEGITGVNFAVQNKSAITCYYQLEYALQYQHPKVVCCDFSALFSDCLPSDTEAVYRKIVDGIPDEKIKLKLIRDICKVDSSQSFLSWEFPLLRYHSTWNNLTKDYFENEYVISPYYKRYSQGCLLADWEYADAETFGVEIKSEMWCAERTDTEYSKISLEYYERFIELCRENNIQVVALIPPKISDAALKTSRWSAMQDYFETNNLTVIDYNTYEEVNRLGLELEKDYYDSMHVNYRGAVKMSLDLAKQLKKHFNLKDHRGDNNYISWDDYWEEFVKAFNYEE